MTAAEIQTAINDLWRQLASGVASVSIDGITTTYRGQADIERAIRTLEKRLTTTPTQRPRVAYGIHRGER